MTRCRLALPHLRTLPSGRAGYYTCPALRPYQFGPMCNPDLISLSLSLSLSLRSVAESRRPIRYRCVVVVPRLMPVAFMTFVCKHAPGTAQRHHALNDVVVGGAFTSAGIPVTKEPTGLSRTDGMTLSHGKQEDQWSGTSCTSADSYVDASARKTDIEQCHMQNGQIHQSVTSVCVLLRHRVH